ncbi:DUF3549 family protein [Thalassotalea sp. HSM 43]|uniref:DUF3549 family protein n=1 Tax=Thalassotalea sp. HSM 43 TaxID=2552945 RepID=UPI001080BAE8|nr:DUF3549 family protein [Thalassotalea sp. HSM 43]QBY03232.1 DUF3549 family protein [Thalassotalea sp. HSM 43]
MSEQSSTKKDTIDTISELLQLSGCQYRIYDLGRKVSKMSKQDFEKVEQAMQPYPFPIQGHAMFALVFWQKAQTTPYIWFVKLPLDERGLLNQGSRNHYLAIILDALGKDLTQDPSEKQEELLQANPYNFTPTQYKLASLNAVVKRDLKQSASQYYEHCQLYMSGKLGFAEWQGVAVQGICDFAARINDNNNSQLLINALNKLPSEVLTPLCSALENQQFDIHLLQAFIEQANNELDRSDVNVQRLADLLRAVSDHNQHPQVIALAQRILAADVSNDLNLLLTFTGKAWGLLADNERLLQYLENVSSHLEQDVFSAVFQDLVAIPTIRPYVLQCLRSPQRSDNLVNAIGAIFAAVQNKK